MKVLLVNFHNHQTNSAMYNLVALASYIENIPDTQIQVLDGIRQPFWDILRNWKPDIVGLTSYTVWYGNVVEKAHQIDSIYNGKIVIGGHHITSLPKSMRVPPFDYSVIGEGEEVLSSLCKGETPSTGLIDYPMDTPVMSNPVDVTRLPVARLDKYTPLSFYNDNMVGIVASRGCPFNCQYCSIRTMSKGVRYYPVEQVINQIELCYNKLGSKTIIFWDDTFGLNIQWLQELIYQLDSKKLLGKIQYHVHCRASTVNEERCELMRKLGVKVWNMGLDFGSDKMLKQTKGKDCSVQKNKEAILMAHKYGIATGGAVMFGAPEETIDNMKETLSFMKWYRDSIRSGLCTGSIWFFCATPLPGTEWWNYAEKRNKVSWDMDCSRLHLHNWREHLLLDDSITNEQFNWIHKEAKKLMADINGSWSEP